MKSNTQIGYGALAVAGLCLLLGSIANAAPTGKTLICHKPGERGQRILNVNLDKDGAKHQSHGDEIPLKVCDIPLDNKNNDCDSTTDEDDGAVSGFCDDLDVLTADSCDSNGTCANVLFCGNGQVDEGEECDDGNNDNEDGCSASCEDETPPPACPCANIWAGNNAHGMNFPNDVTGTVAGIIDDCETVVDYTYINTQGNAYFFSATIDFQQNIACTVQETTEDRIETSTPADDLEACIRYVEIESNVPVLFGCLTD